MALLTAASLLAVYAQAQTAAEPPSRRWQVGLGLSYQYYYTNPSRVYNDLVNTPTLTVAYILKPRWALQTGIATRTVVTNRNENYLVGSVPTHFVQAQRTSATVMPVLLRRTLTRNPGRIQASALGGVTLVYSTNKDRQTYTTDAGVRRQDADAQTFSPFLTGGLGLRYQATPRVSVFADGTLGLRLTTRYNAYELIVPSAMAGAGLGYSF